MKRLLLLLPVLFMLLFSSPVLAFDEPGQSTGNATDVILWYGDNLTIESVTLSGEVTVTGLTGSLEDIAGEYLAFIIVAFLLVIVLIKDTVILNSLGVPVALVFGFRMASEQDVYSSLWMAGVAIGLLGLYFLYRIAMSAVSRGKG